MSPKSGSDRRPPCPRTSCNSNDIRGCTPNGCPSCDLPARTGIPRRAAIFAGPIMNTATAIAAPAGAPLFRPWSRASEKEVLPHLKSARSKRCSSAQPSSRSSSTAAIVYVLVRKRGVLHPRAVVDSSRYAVDAACSTTPTSASRCCSRALSPLDGRPARRFRWHDDRHLLSRFRGPEGAGNRQPMLELLSAYRRSCTATSRCCSSRRSCKS